MQRICNSDKKNNHIKYRLSVHYLIRFETNFYVLNYFINEIIYLKASTKIFKL